MSQEKSKRDTREIVGTVTALSKVKSLADNFFSFGIRMRLDGASFDDTEWHNITGNDEDHLQGISEELSQGMKIKILEEKIISKDGKEYWNGKSFAILGEGEAVQHEPKITHERIEIKKGPQDIVNENLKVMEMCKTVIDELFGNDPRYKDSIGQHLNSLFIAVNRELKGGRRWD